MASRWYRKVGDSEVGPLMFQDLVEFIVAGTLTEDDWVRRELSPEWTRARAVIGLFQAAEKRRRVPHAGDIPSEPADRARPSLIATRYAGSKTSRAKSLEPLDYWILGVAAVFILIVGFDLLWPESAGKFPQPRLWRPQPAKAVLQGPLPDMRRVEESAGRGELKQFAKRPHSKG